MIKRVALQPKRRDVPPAETTNRGAAACTMRHALADKPLLGAALTGPSWSTWAPDALPDRGRSCFAML